MPRKPKEPELELQTSEAPKRETIVTRWFRDNCPDNQEDIRAICELTARSAEEQFRMFSRTKNYEVYAIIFFATFQSIMDFLREKQKIFKRYTFELAQSVNIGYQTSTSVDNEKFGNFMPIMEYIGVNRPIVPIEKTGPGVTEKNFILWKELNIKKNIEHFKEVQEIAYHRLRKEYILDVRSSESIFPLFCTFMDHINNVVRYKYREADGTKVSEVSLTVMGLFEVFYSFDEEKAKEVIQYAPLPFFKLGLKNDSTAGGGQ
jgi:hypothetical protein